MRKLQESKARNAQNIKLFRSLLGLDQPETTVIETKIKAEVKICHYNLHVDRYGNITETVNEDGGVDGIEYRAAMAQYSEAINEVNSYTVTGYMDRLTKSAMGTITLGQWVRKQGYHVIGGTSTNAGRFYGVKFNDGIPYKTAENAVGYISLDMTPVTKHFKIKVLVLSNEEFAKTGLAPDQGGMIWLGEKLGMSGAQVRIKFSTESMAKGVIWERHILENTLGHTIGEFDLDADVVMSEGDIKVLKEMVETNMISEADLGITYTNTETINGQALGDGFEFWQFIKGSDDLRKEVTKLHKKVAEDTTAYDIIVGLEGKRRLAAHLNNEAYKPLKVSTEVGAALMAFGENHYDVQNYVKKNLMRYLIGKPFTESSAKLTLIVNDDEDALEFNSDNPNAILGKYPITAGMKTVRLHNSVTGLPVIPIRVSDAGLINTDGDGDMAFLCQGPISQMIIDNNLVKSLRPLDVEDAITKKSKADALGMSRVVTGIFKHNGLIGWWTLAYNMVEMYRDYYATEEEKDVIDLSWFSKNIEKIIKSNKKQFADLVTSLPQYMQTIVKDMQEKYGYNMNWRPKNHSDSMDQLVNNSITLAEFKNSNLIKMPIGYMDSKWNTIINAGVKKLKEIPEPDKAASYIDYLPEIELEKIEDDDYLKKEVDHLETLNGLWNKVSRNPEIVNKAKDFVTLQSVGISAMAKNIFLREYLSKTSSKSAKFALLIDNFQEAFDGVNFDYDPVKDKELDDDMDVLYDEFMDANRKQHKAKDVGGGFIKLWTPAITRFKASEIERLNKLDTVNFIDKRTVQIDGFRSKKDKDGNTIYQDLNINSRFYNKYSGTKHILRAERTSGSNGKDLMTGITVYFKS